MIMTMVILIISAGIAFAFIPKLKKNKETKTIIIFSIFFITRRCVKYRSFIKAKNSKPTRLGYLYFFTN